MPLTPAQRQARVRTRRREKLERYEAALREIASPIQGTAIGDPWAFYADLQKLAQEALTPGEPR